MSARPALLALAVLVAAVAAAGPLAGPAAGNPAPGERPRVVAVYPNPVLDGDRGEYVAVRFPRRVDLGAWTLADDDANASLPNRSVAGTVAFTADPAVARNRTRLPVVALADGLELANAGERVALRHRGVVVDAVAYTDAPEGERWTPDGWRPLGATDYSPVAVRDARVRAFVLPDAARTPVRALRSADRRLYLAAYTFTSARAVDALAAATRRGVDVRVLVEGGPVGGMTKPEARLLDRLARAGVAVHVVDGPFARYEFHHAKYAVVDDRAFVTTENWKPSGTGGHANRGWGVVVRDAALADRLAGVFHADARWRAAVPWREWRVNRSFEPTNASEGSFPQRFRSRTVEAESVRLVVAPDNAESAVVELVRSANRSVLVEQMSVESGSPFLRAAIAAARRGVRVRILLSGMWYVWEQNRALADRLDNLSARQGLPIDAKLVEPRSRFGKVHAKGVVVDRRRVYVGSLNWNNHSARQNREVGVILESRAAGRYYARVFRADWRGGAWRVSAGVLATLALAVAGAVAYARTEVRFDAG